MIQQTVEAAGVVTAAAAGVGDSTEPNRSAGLIQEAGNRRSVVQRRLTQCAGQRRVGGATGEAPQVPAGPIPPRRRCPAAVTH